MEEVKVCQTCHRPDLIDGVRIVKNGKVHGIQMWKCSDCTRIHNQGVLAKRRPVNMFSMASFSYEPEKVT